LKLVMTTVADLHEGDLLLLPETPLDNLHTVEVTTLHARRSGRVSVWIRSTPLQDPQARPSHYGTFAPSAPIQRVEFR
jgi:hypothetical protein